ncbi:hypothetical protein CQ009_12990 [Pseudomonas sp. MYb2]|uniref:hypothetical protein n=1 Tax=unclassified Pseudomonas TaxID=196821 RepID=UPI000D006567|nr:MULTISPECIES: hypothetical protein [unclassified Pseudomonas]PRB51193.1 hypothetical protein CQ025_09635 [Pseudomonas sp. MYb3]PRC34572.1 hypothetical protein CQ009_12990 [Pseudomonas sp. MYb2]
MTIQFLIEPDWDAEKKEFEIEASRSGLSLEKLGGGFYVSRETQHAWTERVVCAAIACNSNVETQP